MGPERIRSGACALHDKHRTAKIMKDNIGVDISKAHLDAHRLITGDRARFENTAAGFRALQVWLGEARPDLVVFEATGPYHRRFEAAFSGRLPLVKVTPLQARRFAQACGTRAKSDAVDARVLAAMGQALDLVPDEPADSIQSDLKELQLARTGLVKDRTRLMNRLKTLQLAVTRRQARARLAQLDRQIAALGDEIDTRLHQCPRRARACEILVSIPELGAVSARAIVIGCPEIGRLGSKQIAALSGLAPMTRQSGKWHGRATIQGGRADLRQALYMPALVASRHNPDHVRKYQDMIRAGKPPKLALTAIMRKLIELANVLIKTDRKWTPIAP